MYLSPLQSRLGASALGPCLPILLYLCLISPHSAVAFELEPATPIPQDNDVGFSPNPAGRSPLSANYEPAFIPFDRSIIGRAPPENFNPLTNNEPFPIDIDKGAAVRFVFPLTDVKSRESGYSRLELRDEHSLLDDNDAADETGGTEGREGASKLERRQTSRRVYISANTCQQPVAVDPSKTTGSPPQLTLFVSKSPENMAPGLFSDPAQQVMLKFVEGAVMWNFTTKHDVYLAVYAPNVSDEYTGSYNFRIAASTERPYFHYNDSVSDALVWVDSDSQGALLYTQNLTSSNDPAVQEVAKSSQPYVLFAHNQDDTSINGLKHSYCGLQNHAQIALSMGRGTEMVKTSMITRGQEGFVRQQFFFGSLNSSAKYWGILAKDGSSSSGKRQNPVGGGGEVFSATEFETKSSHGNCAIITDLEFCNEVAYSVPSNPNTFSNRDLATWYDTQAKISYENFNKSLSQIQCEAPSSQRYSLVRTCEDCAAAYKNWLCTVAIPRCEDFDNDEPFLQPRAVFQPLPNGERLSDEVLQRFKPFENMTSYKSSRSPRIDDEVKPGPHKELLPCDYLCYDIVRSCPAQMDFGCPKPGGIGFEGNYQQHKPESQKLTCNFQGSAHVKSAAPPRRLKSVWGVPTWALVVVIGTALIA